MIRIIAARSMGWEFHPLSVKSEPARSFLHRHNRILFRHYLSGYVRRIHHRIWRRRQRQRDGAIHCWRALAVSGSRPCADTSSARLQAMLELLTTT